MVLSHPASLMRARATIAPMCTATAVINCRAPLGLGIGTGLWPRLLLLLLVLLAATLLPGCASLPPPPADRPFSVALPADASQGLGSVAARGLAQAQPAGPSAALSLAHPGLALDARLTLIHQARHSIDLQTYHLVDDGTGRHILRALRDAALRGVRVRLLVDDFHTAGTDALLQGLAAHPGAQVRLYNPFMAGRANSAGRWLAMAGDFDRLNRRMHNKLFIADGALAIAGGRNIADGYFQRSTEANFVDFDALLAGQVVPELAAVFDRYWNSAPARDLQAVLQAALSSGPGLPAADGDTLRQRQADFDRRTQGPLPPPVSPPDRNHPVAVAELLAQGLPGLVGAQATVLADAPDKRLRGPGDITGTTTHGVLQLFRESRSELMLFSPYFIPGDTGLAGLQEARRHGIAVRVITNALGANDEPLAALAYERYRLPLVQMGVELYEVSARPDQRDESRRGLFGQSKAQLHAKLALIDRRTLLLGSFNLDQRSASTNTELAVVLRSPQLTAQVLDWFNGQQRRDVRGTYLVELAPDGRLRWRALLGQGRSELHDHEPEADPLRRLGLRLLSVLVPESLL